MKDNRNYKLLTLIMLLSVMLFSCKGGKNSNVSTSTGWLFNNEEYGGFEKINYQPDEAKSVGPNLVLVPGGTFVMGATQDQVLYEWDNIPRRVTINSFYMDRTEVSNHNYCEYLFWMQRVFGGSEDMEKRSVYKRALPDTMVWREPLGYNEPLIGLYLRHPAYQDYPVVGVSWQQASAFSVWRSDRVNEKRLLDNGYLSSIDLNQTSDDFFNSETYVAGLYNPAGATSPNKSAAEGGSTKATYMSGVLLPNYRLPTEAEWEYAALGLIGNMYGENLESRRIYPWDGNHVRISDPKSKQYGQFADNFKRAKGDYMGVANRPNDGYAIPAPVASYAPNDYGLFNMAGNVAEWVQDIYRPLSFEDVDDYSPFRGNLFQIADVDPDTGLPMKDPVTGLLKKRDVEESDYEDVSSRRNYRKADYKNYKDGDWESLIVDYKDVSKKWSEVDPAYGTQEMYTSDSEDPGDIRTLISDKSRVVKGGSWRDPAYYMSPSVRRYMDEDISTNYIGFRCAMNRMGGN